LITYLPFATCSDFVSLLEIRDLADKRLYVPGRAGQWSSLSPLIGGSINERLIEQQLSEVLRLAASIQQGTVTASLILRKLGSYPRQNSLALALRELGRLERTLFTLAWIEDPSLRRRVTAGLNKGEARNSLAKAVFFNRLGEIRRSFENQRYRASGLNLVVAAITLWNTVYLERAAEATVRAAKYSSPGAMSIKEEHFPTELWTPWTRMLQLAKPAAIGGVHLQQGNRRSAYGGAADNGDSIALKVLIPLVLARMKQPDEHTAFRVESAQVRPLVRVAVVAG
jgi:Tn3 transposase DDE domain